MTSNFLLYVIIPLVVVSVSSVWVNAITTEAGVDSSLVSTQWASSTSTSTVRPWPSDKFLRKVLSESKASLNSQTAKTNSTSLNSRSHNHNLNVHKTSKNYTSVGTNLLRDRQSGGGLSGRNGSVSRLSSNISEHNSNDSIVNTGTFRRVYVNSGYNEEIDLAKLFNQSGLDYGNSKYYVIEDADREDSFTKVPVNLKPVTNYGIGFQYEILPLKEPNYNFTNTTNISKFRRKSSKSTSKSSRNNTRTINSLRKSTTLPPPTTLRSTRRPRPTTTSSPTRRTKPPKISKESKESTNKLEHRTTYGSWERIPTLQVTLRPVHSQYSHPEYSEPDHIDRYDQYESDIHQLIQHITKRPTLGNLGLRPSRPKSTTTSTTTPSPFSFSPFTLIPTIPVRKVTIRHPSSPPPLPLIVTTQRPIRPRPTTESFPLSPINQFYPEHQYQPQYPYRPTIHKNVHITSGSGQSPPSDSKPNSNSNTNIWYKPIINHFIQKDPPSPHWSLNPLKTVKTTTNSISTPLVFNIWSYKDGKLNLVKQKEIPGWALDGFDLNNLSNQSSILNLDQIPSAVQSVVQSAIAQLNGPEIQGDYNLHVPQGWGPLLKVTEDEIGPFRPQIHHSQPNQQEKDNRVINYVIVDRNQHKLTRPSIPPPPPLPPMNRPSRPFSPIGLPLAPINQPLHLPIPVRQQYPQSPTISTTSPNQFIHNIPISYIRDFSSTTSRPQIETSDTFDTDPDLETEIDTFNSNPGPNPSFSPNPNWDELHNLLLSSPDYQEYPDVQDNPDNSGFVDRPIQDEYDQLHQYQYDPDQYDDPVQKTQKTQKTSEKDSFHQGKGEDKKLMADLAAAAILISYLRQPQPSQLPPIPPPQVSQLPPVLPQMSQLPPMPTDQINVAPYSNDAPQIYHQLLSQLLQQYADRNLPPISPTPTLPPKKPPRDKSLLVLKGLVKKGVKKKVKKKLKKKAKQKLKKTKSSLFDQLSLPMIQLMKNPKQYWFDLKFDVDLYDIMRKKFLYLLAMQYMPVILVVALALVPLGFVIIPLLWKIYWVKKWPKYKYIKIHVPVPKPYPVYQNYPLFYTPESQNDQEGQYPHEDNNDPSKYPNFPPSDSSDAPNYPNFPPQENNYVPDYPNYPLPYNLDAIRGQSLRGQEFSDPQFDPSPLSIGPTATFNNENIRVRVNQINPHPIDIQNLENSQKFGNIPEHLNEETNFRPLAVTHAYELGFDLGSKLGTMTNKHDKEVLKILIDSRKSKIRKLLQKWDLLHKGKGTTPIHKLAFMVKEHQENQKLSKKNGEVHHYKLKLKNNKNPDGHQHYLLTPKTRKRRKKR